MSLEHMQSVEGNGYEKYKNAGGFLNEKDYAEVCARVKNKKTVDSHSLGQAQSMARAAGILLESRNDPRIVLYDVLHDVLLMDTKRDAREYHYSKLDDQPLFAEALRISEDTESLEKFLKAHPNIFQEGK